VGDEAPRTNLIFKLSTLAGEIALQFHDNTSASVVRALFALAESVRLRQRVALTVIDGEPGATRPAEDPAAIVVTRRRDDYHACLKSNPGIWGRGVSPSEAIGDMLRSHPGCFGVLIEDFLL
jgi:hypothetical protein